MLVAVSVSVSVHFFARKKKMEYTVIQQERYLQIENGVNYIGGRIRRIFLARIEIETVAAYYTSSFPNARLYLFNVINKRRNHFQIYLG